MSYTTPSPGAPGQYTTHQTFVAVDPVTGGPMSPPEGSPAVLIRANDAVSVGSVAVLLAAENPSRIELEFYNVSGDPFAYGASGITWANRCTPLEVGDSRIQTAGANLAWYGICGAGKTASVTVREVLR